MSIIIRFYDFYYGAQHTINVERLTEIRNKIAIDLITTKKQQFYEQQFRRRRRSHFESRNKKPEKAVYRVHSRRKHGSFNFNKVLYCSTAIVLD